MFKLFLLFLSLAFASTVEVHFYNSSSLCGLTEKSDRFFYFETGVCYLNTTLLGVVDCNSEILCLGLHLDADSYQSCLQEQINGTIGIFGGSFEVETTDHGNYRLQYVTNNCFGPSDRIRIEDDCDLNRCSGEILRQQIFPQFLEPETEDDEGSEEDDDDKKGSGFGIGAIIGVSVAGAVLILFCLLVILVSFCCIVLFVVVVIIVIVLIVIFFIFRWRKISKQEVPKANMSESTGSEHSEEYSDVDL